MESTRIIQQGEEAKFQIAISNFTLRTGEFKVELIYGFRRTIVEINKRDMFSDTDGNWYFCFDTDGMVGRVTARCTWYLEDADASGGIREKVDEQYLCFVVNNPCPMFITCPSCAGTHQVTYTRCDISNVEEYYYRLCDSNGNAILTSDNNYICVLKEAVEAAVNELEE